MAVVTSKNGLIIMASGDTYTPANNSEIMAIIVVDGTGSTSGTLTDNGAIASTLFSFVSNGTAGNFWYGFFGCINTGKGLAWTGVNTTVYIYIK